MMRWLDDLPSEFPDHQLWAGLFAAVVVISGSDGLGVLFLCTIAAWAILTRIVERLGARGLSPDRRT